jgi:hypothetical protein
MTPSYHSDLTTNSDAGDLRESTELEGIMSARRLIDAAVQGKRLSERRATRNAGF